MLCRLLMLLLICLGSFAWQAPDAEAGWRANRRAARSRVYYRQSRSRSRYTRSSTSNSNKPHMTQSRSAVLDGFFGPGNGPGHDRSWYVGK